MAKVNRSSCYAPAEPDPGQGTPDEFQPAALLAWSDRLTGIGACQAVVGLILKLETMSRVRMPGGDRALLLHFLEGPLHRLFEGMPRLTPKAVRTAALKGWDLTMEQRLACVVYRNLARTLRDLDDTPEDPGEHRTETRLWVLEQQFVLLARQIDHAARARLSPPPGTWLELHGRYKYFLEWFGRSGGDPLGVGLDSDVDLSSSYKRLLLLGIAAGAAGVELTAEGFAARLRAWVMESRLEAPRAAGLGPGVWVVDAGRDGPPYKPDGPVELGPRCSVLIPARAFQNLLRSSGPAGSGGPAGPGFG